MATRLIFNWKEVVEDVSSDRELLKSKDIPNLITYARQFGIGKPVSFQTTSYFLGDIAKVKRLVLWWKMLNKNSSIEWRGKKTSILIQKIIIKAVANGSKIQIYAVFCPSYKKGAGVYGYTGKTGNHTQSLMRKMSDFIIQSEKIGIKVDATAFFSDLLLESYQELIGSEYQKDLDNNYLDFKLKFKDFSRGRVKVRRLSSLKIFREHIGKQGVQVGDLGVPNNIYERVLARNKVFYIENLDWNEKEVAERTSILARSYAFMGEQFRKMFPSGIMYWVESAYERGLMYSGIKQDEPLPIIYPLKDDE